MLHEISPNKSYEIKKNVEHSHKLKERSKSTKKLHSIVINNLPTGKRKAP